jgi:hypothetical protein
MRYRQRQNEEQPRETEVEGGGGEGLGSVRNAGESLLSAADDAIDRALSADSTAFLRATQQSGGE